MSTHKEIMDVYYGEIEQRERIIGRRCMPRLGNQNAEEPTAEDIFIEKMRRVAIACGFYGSKAKRTRRANPNA
jgi:hypothetical protein